MDKFKKDINIMQGKGEWVESQHPRDSDGKFTSKGGGQSTMSQETTQTQSTKKDAIEHLNTSLSKNELVKKIRTFEPIKLMIGDKEITAQFDRSGAKKIVYGKSESKERFETQKDHNVKLKNIERLPEFIKTSRYERSSLEDGKSSKTHLGVKEWHYFVNKVDINNKKYDIFIDIRDKGQNQYVYFVRFKEIKQ